MKTDTNIEQKKQVCEKRRQQVLDAAEICFREKGFHGSSIANISRAAGMSPGHIYYHFADKEAIVEELIERQKSEFSKLLLLLETAKNNKEILSILLKEIPSAVDRHLDPPYAQLWLEIASESARTPRVAKILQQSEQLIIEQIRSLILKHADNHDPESINDIQARLELIGILICGLSMKAPLASTLNKKTVIRLIKDVVIHLLKDPKKQT